MAESWKAEWAWGAQTVFQKGEKKNVAFYPSDYGIVDPGEYEIWVVYDASSLDKAWGPSELIRGTIESNHVAFRLAPPQGVDAEALKNFANRCNRITLTNEELLNRFPTSTYAGYVLAKKVPDYSDPLFHPVPPQEQLKQCRDEGKTFVTFPDKAFEEYFQQLGRFMQGGRVPESLRASLWCFYGDQLVRRGKFAEAEEAFAEAAKGKEPFDPKEKAYWCRAEESLHAFASKKAKTKDSGAGKPGAPLARISPE